MGMVSFNPFKDMLANLFKTKAAEQKPPGDGSAKNPVGYVPPVDKPSNPIGVPAGNPPGYYQIQPGQTDLNQISAQTGVPLPTLVDANGGAKTLPPSGSYIALQPEGKRANGIQPPSATSRPSANIDQYGQPIGRGNPYGGAPDVVNRAFDTFAENYRLTGQVNPNLLPSQINISTVKALEAKGFFPSMDGEGNPTTPAQALNAYGYTWNAGTYSFQRTGTPGTNAPAKPDYTKPTAGMVMDNKFVAVRQKSGKIVWRQTGSSWTPDEVPIAAPPPPAANAPGTSQTLLGLRLGSG